MSKRVFALFLLSVLLIVCSCNGKTYKEPKVTQDKLTGVWRNGDIEFNFSYTTLYIDELNNEGFDYTYDISGDTLIYQNYIEQDQKFYIKIVSLNDSVLRFYYLDDPRHIFTYKKEKESLFMKEYEAAHKSALP